MQGTWLQSLGWEDPLEREWQPTPEFLPGEFQEQWSLAGYIQSMGWQRFGHTERLTLYYYTIIAHIKTNIFASSWDGKISPEYSLEGLMLKLKLQYFDHLMQRTDSLEKTLMLGKIEGGRRG